MSGGGPRLRLSVRVFMVTHMLYAGSFFVLAIRRRYPPDKLKGQQNQQKREEPASHYLVIVARPGDSAAVLGRPWFSSYTCNKARRH